MRETLRYGSKKASISREKVEELSQSSFDFMKLQNHLAQTVDKNSRNTFDNKNGTKMSGEIDLN